MGHVFKDCDKSLVRQVWMRKGMIVSELEGIVNPTLNPTLLARKHIIDEISVNDQLLECGSSKGFSFYS
jgi:hypothetical protein